MKRSPQVLIKNILSTGSHLKDRYIPKLKELKVVTDNLKNMGYRIVLTQGVFDLIHEGHAEYLEKALALGDILVVGVDSDALTRKRKGPNRPVVPQAERLRMLAYLRSVGILTLRDVGEDIGTLIRTLKPDVLVTSKSTKDFSTKEKREYHKYCKKIVILPAQSTTSTSARIRNLTIDGARELSEKVTKLLEEYLKKQK